MASVTDDLSKHRLLVAHVIVWLFAIPTSRSAQMHRLAFFTSFRLHPFFPNLSFVSSLTGPLPAWRKSLSPLPLSLSSLV